MSAILGRPLPYLNGFALTRFLVRSMLLVFRSRIIEVRGLERVDPAHDPFILALNHSQRLEALLVPAVLCFHRDGKLIHFLADWNFLLVPGIATLFRCGQTIPISRKPAKPRFLNVFKSLLTDPEPGFDRAKHKLMQRASLGIFPEGTSNRDPRRLLKGYSGAAQLSLGTGTPVIPAGIRFPDHPADRPISPLARMTIEIGHPLTPPACEGAVDFGQVREWHRRIMEEIARLSGKHWQPQTHRRGYVPKK